MRTYCTCGSLRSDISKHIAINGLRGVRAWGVVPKPGDARVCEHWAPLDEGDNLKGLGEAQSPREHLEFHNADIDVRQTTLMVPDAVRRKLNSLNPRLFPQGR